jgi:hypothetical protein
MLSQELFLGVWAFYQFVGYGHFASFLKNCSFLPFDRLHKTSYTLAGGFTRLSESAVGGATSLTITC